MECAAVGVHSMMWLYDWPPVSGDVVKSNDSITKPTGWTMSTETGDASPIPEAPKRWTLMVISTG